jgi:hypothetical protein
MRLPSLPILEESHAKFRKELTSDSITEKLQRAEERRLQVVRMWRESLEFN